MQRDAAKYARRETDRANVSDASAGGKFQLAGYEKLLIRSDERDYVADSVPWPGDARAQTTRDPLASIACGLMYRAARRNRDENACARQHDQTQ